MHVKNHLNGLGGTRDSLIQERLDEWRFKRDYLRSDSHQYNFWKVLQVLRHQGWAAKLIVDREYERAEQGDDEDSD